MINCMSVIGIGFIIGILSGLFGVGGGFLLVPLLNAVFGVPYNIAIGSSLFQMVATSRLLLLQVLSTGVMEILITNWLDLF